MAMGIVSDDDFVKELNDPRSKSITNKTPLSEIINIPSHGRPPGPLGIETPQIIREIIGEESVTQGRSAALSIAKQFGISNSSVSAYAKGATSTATYNEPDKTLGPKIKSAKDRVVSRARRKLFMALDHLTDEKMEDTKARDLAGIAKDMSAIIRNIEPPAPEVNDNGPKFILYAPQFIQESKLEVIEVND